MLNLDLGEWHLYAGWLLLAAGAGIATGASLGLLVGIGIGLLVAGIGGVLMGILIARSPAEAAKASPTPSQQIFAPMVVEPPQEETA